MRVSLKVVARSRQERVEGPLADGSYKVHVHAPPVDGEANEAVCRVLADHFKVAKRSVRIVVGQSNPRKIAEIED